MKRIINPKQLLFVTYCTECDCVFEYEEEDTINGTVTCPKCESYCSHLTSNIKR